MTSTDSLCSPRYFVQKNRDSEASHGDGRGGIKPHLQPASYCRNRSEPRRAQILAALDILDIVAGRDTDHARKRNGVGFSRADSSRGHMLSKFSADAVLRNPALIFDVLKMAAKYRRQASGPRQFDLL